MPRGRDGFDGDRSELKPSAVSEGLEVELCAGSGAEMEGSTRLGRQLEVTCEEVRVEVGQQDVPYLHPVLRRGVQVDTDVAPRIDHRSDARLGVLFESGPTARCHGACALVYSDVAF